MITIILAIENEEDREFMTQIHEKYYPLLMSIAVKNSSNLHDAQDIVNETFIKLINNIQKLQSGNYSLRPYITAILRNTIYEYYRGTKKVDAKTSCGNENDIADCVEDPNDTELQVINEETMEEMMWAINELSERDRLLLINKYYLGYLDRENAGFLNINEKNVRMYISRARKRLGNIITEKQKKKESTHVPTKQLLYK